MQKTKKGPLNNLCSWYQFPVQRFLFFLRCFFWGSREKAPALSPHRRRRKALTGFEKKGTNEKRKVKNDTERLRANGSAESSHRSSCNRKRQDRKESHSCCQSCWKCSPSRIYARCDHAPPGPSCSVTSEKLQLRADKNALLPAKSPHQSSDIGGIELWGEQSSQRSSPYQNHT